MAGVVDVGAVTTALQHAPSRWLDVAKLPRLVLSPLSNCAHNLGNLFERLGQAELALLCARQALAALQALLRYEPVADPLRFAMLLTTLSLRLSVMHQPVEALTCADEAVRLCHSLEP